MSSENKVCVALSVVVVLMLLGLAPFTPGADVRAPVSSAPEPSFGAGFGALEVTSEPPGATVFLDNVFAGTTPYVAPRRRTGSYNLRVALEWYLPWERKIVVKGGKTLKEDVKLQPDFGLVTIWCNTTARVTIDGEHVRNTPLRDFRVRPGTHYFRVSAPYYEPEQGRIEASPGQRLEFRVNLIRQQGNLTIYSQLSDAEIYLDGQRRKQQTPALFEGLSAGPHVVRLKRGPLEAFGHVVVEADTTTELRLQLERAKTQVEGDLKPVEPELAAAHMRSGDEYLRRGLSRQAAEEYARAIVHDPHNPVLFNNLGVAQYRRQRWKEAKKSLLTAVLIDQNYADAWYNLGCVYTREGDMAKAAEVLKAAVSLDANLRIDLYVDQDLAPLRAAPEFRLLLHE